MFIDRGSIEAATATPVRPRVPSLMGNPLFLLSMIPLLFTTWIALAVWVGFDIARGALLGRR